jgi:hypothetical protein
VTLREALALTLLYASVRDAEVRMQARTLVPALDEAVAVIDGLVERECAERDHADCEIRDAFLGKAL